MIMYILSLCGGIEAAEIRVPSDYDTIQAALNAAQNGDEVIIADGTYQGEGNRDLNLGNKAITVRSENGPTNCIIDCQGTEAENYRGFEFSNTSLGPDTILDGVTIRNGYKSGGGGQGSGGAIFCAGGSPTIRNCILSGNYAGAGGGLYLYETNSRIENCVIQQNTATNGGGVYASGSSNEPNMVACVISDNIAAFDGGGICIHQAVITISGCAIIYNQAIGRRGGGIECKESSALVKNCLIQGNVADWGGGFISTEGNSLLLNSIIRGNTQAGVYLNFDDSDVINCLIEGNSYNSEGAGIVARACHSILRNCTVVGNRASGRSIYIHDESEMDLVNNIIVGNDETGTEQIYINDNSTAAVSYCDIEGGQGGVVVGYESSLDWGDGSLNAEPAFAVPGYWDDNDTPGDESDDTWIKGYYYLLPGSNCIDVADNSEVEPGETDLFGLDRILNSVVDMGAYEYTAPEELAVESIQIKAGKTREAQKDSFSLSGILEAEEADFLAADYIALRCGPWVEVLDASAFKQSGKKSKYSYKGPAGGVTKMVLDFSKNTFSADGKSLVLSGTTTPIILVFLIGDTYYAYAAVSDESMINGKKDLPIQLLAGNTNAMKVDKVVCKPGKDNNVGNLVVKGQLAAAGEVDLTTTDLTLHWGDSEYPILTDDEGFRLVGKTKYQHKKSPDVDDPATIVISIDFVKCTFQVVAKNTNWLWEDALVNFGLEFGSFNEQEEVDF